MGHAPGGVGAGSGSSSGGSSGTRTQSVEDWTDEDGVGQTAITGYNNNANGARNRDHFAWSKIYGTMGVDRLVNARGPQSGKLAPLQRASGWTPTISDVRYGVIGGC